MIYRLGIKYKNSNLTTIIYLILLMNGILYKKFLREFQIVLINTRLKSIIREIHIKSEIQSFSITNSRIPKLKLQITI